MEAHALIRTLTLGAVLCATLATTAHAGKFDKPSRNNAGTRDEFIIGQQCMIGSDGTQHCLSLWLEQHFSPRGDYLYTYFDVRQTYSNDVTQAYGSREISCSVPSKGVANITRDGASISTTLPVSGCARTGYSFDPTTGRYPDWLFGPQEPIQASISSPRYLSRYRQRADTQDVETRGKYRSECNVTQGYNNNGSISVAGLTIHFDRNSYGGSQFGHHDCQYREN